MKINFSSKYLTAVVFCFFFFSLSSQAAFSQDFSSIDQDLAQLESLINDTLTNTQEQEKLQELFKLLIHRA